MDLRRLQTFLQIAEHGSVSKASDRLRIAQPALSRQIRLLEADVGLALFDRHRRGMNLTQAGEELRRRISGPLQDLHQAIDDIRARSEQGGGHISFGLPPTVSSILAGRLARRVANQVPNVSLRIVEGYSGHLIDWLHRGEIDVAILYGPAADLHLRCEELLIEPLVLAGPGNSSLDPAKAVKFAELADLPLVLPSHPNGLRVIVENAARRAKVKLDIRFEADSFLVMKDLVQAGLGYTTLPLSAMRAEIDSGRMRHAPLASPNMVRHLILGARMEAEQSHATRLIGRLIREEIAALVKADSWPAFLQFDPESAPFS